MKNSINNLIILFRIGFASILFCTACSKNGDETHPNIIFFFSDDQAYDTHKAFGNPNVNTPNIDGLAEQGVVFLRHYNTTAICMASRASVMTGLYEYKTGCNFNHGALGTKQWQSSYPVLLKQADYRIGFGGKFGFSVSDVQGKDHGGKEGENARHDFDFWVGGPGQTSFETAKNPTLAKYADEYPHSTRAYGAATIDFIRESVNKNQPFCMSVFYKAPHRPVQPDPLYDDIYKSTNFRKLPNYGRKAGEHFSQHSTKGRQYVRFEEWGYHTDKTYQKALQKYNQLIYGIDQSVGMVLEELKKLNIDDNTIIIYSSDNGYFNGSHGLGSKVLPYEEGARVPLIIYDPRNTESGTMRKTTSITGGVDITATILDLAGVEIPTVLDGKSLMPILNNPDKQVRETLPIIQVWGPEETRCFTIMDNRYKYIYWYFKDENQNLKPSEELYDMISDPFEMINVVSDNNYQNVLIEMRKKYDSQLAHWKEEGVNYNGYPRYVTLFDRNIDWEMKSKILNMN